MTNIPDNNPYESNLSGEISRAPSSLRLVPAIIFGVLGLMSFAGSLFAFVVENFLSKSKEDLMSKLNISCACGSVNGLLWIAISYCFISARIRLGLALGFLSVILIGLFQYLGVVF